MADLVNMSDEEFRMYKKETLRRLVRIMEAEGHAIVALVTMDNCGILVDMSTGKMIYSMGGDKENL